MINISEVRIKKINKGNFLGYASIQLDNSFIIDGIELHEGEKGRYIYMPFNNKVKKIRRNTAYPTNNETRLKILNAISEKFDQE